LSLDIILPDCFYFPPEELEYIGMEYVSISQNSPLYLAGQSKKPHDIQHWCGLLYLGVACKLPKL
jgi:protein tyrosine phosphatase